MAKTLAQRAREVKAKAHRVTYHETNIIKHLARQGQPTHSVCGRDFTGKRHKIATQAEWNNLAEKKCKSCDK